MSAEEWDERYADHDDQMWSGNANGTLVIEIAGLPIGRALDVGCGEGGDAIWLASRGWQVTAVDISEVALDRARSAAASAGVTVDWVRADLTVDPLEAGAFDLVTVHYPALPKVPEDVVVRVLLDAIAPGGTLLFVGHALHDLQHMREKGIDPDDYVHPGDVAARLDEGWHVDVHETRPRVSPSPGRTAHVDDTVLRAHRP